MSMIMASIDSGLGDMAHPDIDLGFPNEPLWTGLLERAKTISDAILNDTTLGAEVTLTQLLHDVTHVRRALWEKLPRTIFESTPDGGRGLIKSSAPYIALSTRPNYEFYVAALAILSVGGAIVRVREYLPTSPHPVHSTLLFPPTTTSNLLDPGPISSDEENVQVLRECQVSGILTGPLQMAACQALRDRG